MATPPDDEKVKLRWRGEETVQLPHFGVQLEPGDTFEVPLSLVNVDNDPNAEGFYFPPETWSFVGGEPKKKTAPAAKAEDSAAAEKSTATPKAGK